MTGAASGATIGTSDAAILSAAETTRYYLDLRNLSLTATICLNFGMDGRAIVAEHSASI